MDFTPPPGTLPLQADGHGSLAYWRDQVQAAEDKRSAYKEEWDRNLQSYLARTLETIPEYDTVVVPKDFANVERKKAELFFQLPEVHLIPKMPGLEDAILTFQAVLNHYLGPDGVDASALMAEVLFDALCPSGLMCAKIGYENFIGGMSAVTTGTLMGQPQLTQAPQILHERYFWQRISPAKMLIPVDFDGSNYDRAAWLGFEFEEDWEVLARHYGLDPTMNLGGSLGTDRRLRSDRYLSDSRGMPKRIRGWELWYHASLYDPAIRHPEKFRRMVLLDGLDQPVRHTDSPYQREGPNHQLTGLMGNPIHVGALRYVSDTAYPPSEVSIGRAQVKELSKSRTQMLLQRERSVPMRWADVGRIGGMDALRKIERNVWQSIIPLPAADANNLPIGEIQRSSFPNENFGFDRVIERDLNEIWAFGANQRGDVTEERKTATEIRNIQANVSARMDFERKLAIRYFVKGVEKLGALIQLFADQQAFVRILGPDGVSRLQAWDKTAIAGEYVYEAKPDSAVRVDASQDFQDTLSLYNLLAKDDHVNRVELLNRLARLKNVNPERLIVPQLPPKGPPPPSVGFTFKGEDLDPRNPHFPIVVEIMTQAGYQISPEAIQQSQAHAELQQQVLVHAAGPSGVTHPALPSRGHGGVAPHAERLTKHLGPGAGAHNPTGELPGPPTGTTMGTTM